MNSNRVVPYLARVNSCEGTRQKPELLYVTRVEKKIHSFSIPKKMENFSSIDKNLSTKNLLYLCAYTRKIQDLTIVMHSLRLNLIEKD